MEQNKQLTYDGLQRQFMAAFDLYLTYNDAIHQCHDIPGGEDMMKSLRTQSQTWRIAWNDIECVMIDRFRHTYGDTLDLQNRVYERRMAGTVNPS